MSHHRLIRLIGETVRFDISPPPESAPDIEYWVVGQNK